MLLVNLLAILGFGALFLSKQNYEFVIYVGVIIFFLFLILLSHKKITYTDATLWGLTIWSILHMAGGGIYIEGVRLYEIMLLPILESYPVLRYDQFVHIFGFGASTLVMYCLLQPYLKAKIIGFTALSIVIVMAGLGVGAWNEIVEFFVAEIVAASGVGGYLNTSLDLVADLIGAILGLIYIRWRYLGTKR